jgi:hypothetical protein
MSRSIPALLAALLIVGGCKGKRQPEEDWLNQAEAQKLLQGLTEVSAWQQQIARTGHRPVFTVKRTPAECKAAGEQPVWRFQLAAVSGTGTVNWHRLQVDAAGGEVGVWSRAQGRFVPIEVYHQRGGR